MASWIRSCAAASTSGGPSHTDDRTTPSTGVRARRHRPDPNRPIAVYSGPRTPTAARQGRRLTPQFAALREALTAGRAQTADATAEPDPELVVVFDVAGTVDRFVRAVAGIEGLEFLAELAENPTEPDEDFYYKTGGEATDAAVPETLYMVMSNAHGDV